MSPVSSGADESGVSEVGMGNQAAIASMSSHDQIADGGFVGEEIALPYVSEMEKSFGVSFAGVSAFAGPEAAEANEALGAKAYAKGDQVAFGSKNPSKEVVAHELAHVVQQSGATPAVQAKSEGGGSGGYEADADQAAAAAVAGEQAQVFTSAPSGGVQRWAGNEHQAFGNLAAIRATVDEDKGLKDFEVMSGNKDNKNPDKRNFNKVYDKPDVTDVHPQEKDLELKDLASAAKERSRVEFGWEYPEYGDRYMDSISFGKACEVGGDYGYTPDAMESEMTDGLKSENSGTWEYKMGVKVAMTNINHFFPLNQTEYARHHQAAILAAVSGDRKTALMEEGFASHFLQDSFASGHMAPRALDQIGDMGWMSDQWQSDLALHRSKDWHDSINAVTSGLPTSRGRFHGDHTMDGHDLDVIGTDCGKSLKQVLDTLTKREVAPEPQIELPRPDVSAIESDKDYGPLWSLMMDDYQEDMSALQERAEQNPDEEITTDGGAVMTLTELAANFADGIYGGQTKDLTRVTNAEWNGANLVFNLAIGAERAPAGTEVWVEWFDLFRGYDYVESGRKTGFISSAEGADKGLTQDSKIGGPDRIVLADVGLGSAMAPISNPGDTYAVMYADEGLRVPIGRSNVQGESKGEDVDKPVKTSDFNWSGSTLTFQVSRDGEPASESLFVRWYNMDSARDRDEKGNMSQTVVDSDAPIGDVQEIQASMGKASVTAEGDAAVPGNTYGTIFLDEACTIPLGVSDHMPYSGIKSWLNL